MNYKNCNIEIESNFCPNCGQPSELKRIDGHYILHEIEHLIHFERGFLYTVKELLLRPGKNVREYLSVSRSRLIKPIVFIIITSIIYTLISHFFHIEDEYIKASGLDNSVIGTFLKWMQGNYGYANILTGAFIALWLKIFFKKYGYNFFEILILFCFVTGITMLIYALFALFEGIFHFKLFFIAGIIGILYSVWAIAQFFDKNKLSNYFKALFAFMLGTITFYIIIFAIGLTIDMLLKH